MDSGRRTQQLVSEILELLREVSYETQRQDKAIGDLRAKIDELEASNARLEALRPKEVAPPGP